MNILTIYFARSWCFGGVSQVYAASSLPHTPLSRYIEWRVRQRLTTLENEKAAATLSIRLISNVEVRWCPSPLLLGYIRAKSGRAEWLLLLTVGREGIFRQLRPVSWKAPRLCATSDDEFLASVGVCFFLRERSLLVWLTVATQLMTSRVAQP